MYIMIQFTILAITRGWDYFKLTKETVAHGGCGGEREGGRWPEPPVRLSTIHVAFCGV